MTTYLKLHLQVDSANCQPLNHVKVVADDNFIDKSGLVDRHRRLHAEAESFWKPQEDTT